MHTRETAEALEPDPTSQCLGAGVSDSEVVALSQSVIKSHSPRAVSLACLVQLTRSAFVKQSQDLTPLLTLQCECVRSYMREHGMPNGEVSAALEALQQAGSTAEYLDSLPS